MPKPEVEECRVKGNECMKENKHIEAMLHYTRAIKLDPRNHLLYSNRSLAFLKIQQFYHAYEDAQRCIKLMPNWAKGYYRKGEVSFAAEEYKDALQSYKQGLEVEPDDTGLQDAVKKASRELQTQKASESKIPLYGVGMGVLMGALVVMADETAAEKPMLNHVLLKFLAITVAVMIFYGLAVAYRMILRNQRLSLLQPPPDIFGDGKGDEELYPDMGIPSSKPNTEQAGSANTKARQRTRKGRS